MSVETSLMIIAICAIFLSLSLLAFIGVAIKVAINLDQKLETLRGSTEKMLSEGAEIAEKIKSNIDATKPVFHSIAKAGALMNDFTEKLSDEVREKPFKRIISYPPQPIRNRKESKISTILEFVSLGILMWQQIKKGADNE